MAVTENARHKLYQRLESVIGPDEADTIMELLPPVGWAQVATKDDLHQLDMSLRSEIASLGASLRSEIASLDTSLRSEIASLGASLRSEIGSVDTSLRSEIASVGTDLTTLGARIDVDLAGLRAEMFAMSADIHRTMRANTLVIVGAVAAINSAFAALLTLA